MLNPTELSRNQLTALLMVVLMVSSMVVYGISIL